MLKMISLVAVLALCAGCGTIAPAVYGKTFYKQSFEDVEPDAVTETGEIVKGAKTTYHLEIKAPAGVKLDDITGMEYKWDQQQGFIAVNKSGTTDTSGQVEVINATTNAIGSGVANVAAVAGALTGQKLQFDADDKARDDANDAASDQRIADIVEKVIDKKLNKKPATPPADSTLGEVGLPVVGAQP